MGNFSELTSARHRRLWRACLGLNDGVSFVLSCGRRFHQDTFIKHSHKGTADEMDQKPYNAPRFRYGDDRGRPWLAKEKRSLAVSPRRCAPFAHGAALPHTSRGAPTRGVGDEHRRRRMDRVTVRGKHADEETPGVRATGKKPGHRRGNLGTQTVERKGACA